MDDNDDDDDDKGFITSMHFSTSALLNSHGVKSFFRIFFFFRFILF